MQSKQLTARCIWNWCWHSSPLRSLVFIFVGAVVALACGFSYITDHSVRFNSERRDRGFYRLPPLPIMYAASGREFSTKQIENYYGEEEPDDDVFTEPEAVDQTWNQAQASIEAGELKRARTELAKFLELTATQTFDDDVERQAKRNTAVDMRDAIDAQRNGASAKSVSGYLEARNAYDQEITIEKLDELKSQAPSDKSLKDNWEYLRAATLYKLRRKEDALAAFRSQATQFPRSEKNEAAMYMIAKLVMESSYSFGKLGCGMTPEASELEPLEKCRDEARDAALVEFRRLMQRYPNGEYFNDARGWIAYLHRRGGERAQALAEYYRMLGSKDRNVRIEAKRSLQFMGHANDDAVLDEVEKLIAPDADAAMAYAYHRIYNHAIDLTSVAKERWCCWGENRGQQEQEENERVKTANEAGTHELERVARFATSMLGRHSQSRVSGGFVLRVAEAQLELQNFSEALNLANKALGMGVQGDLRAQALWVKGSAEHQRKDLAPATRTFEKLIAEFPASNYVEGSRRLLAMIAEDHDDLETALEHYLKLNYTSDVAYFIDVLLPTDRLAKFVSDRPTIAQHNQLTYALAVRYMRDKRWAIARETFQKVETESRPAPNGCYFCADGPTIQFAKTPEWDIDYQGKISTGWVMRDLKTIEAVENLERAVEIAQGDEAKAEAMYQLASYHFDASSLLFYNPAAWEGGRYSQLSDLSAYDRFRLPNESQILFEHFQSHDTLARAIPIYLEIADRYPQTKAAKDALYSAAVAHERLSGLNPYWRDIYERKLFAGSRLVTYANVRAAYPRYQLPRATYGWEASTRTVNGGPGWAAPPKPAPKETRERRVKRLLKEAASEISARLLPKVQTRVDAGLEWYASALRAALYGLLSGIGLWIVILVGLGLHSRRSLTSFVSFRREPDGADSRVDKMID